MGVLVIGYGNPSRGDDGLGWHACRRLQRLLPAGRATITTVHQLTPELAEDVSRCDLAIFIDAACAGGSPGDLLRHDVDLAGATSDGSGHHCTPEAILAYARALYGRAPRAVTFCIVGQSFDFSMRLTRKVRDAMEDLLQQVVAEIDACHAGDQAHA